MVTYQTPSGNQGPVEHHRQPRRRWARRRGLGRGVTATATNVGGFDFLPAQPQRSVDAEAGLAWDRTGGANDGRVYLVYTDETPGREQRLRRLRALVGRQRRELERARAGQRRCRHQHIHMLPKIALDQTNGDLAVTFYDARATTRHGPDANDLDGTANNDVHSMARSWFNDGATWAPTSRSATHRPTATTSTVPRSWVTTPARRSTAACSTRRGPTPRTAPATTRTAPLLWTSTRRRSSPTTTRRRCRSCRECQRRGDVHPRPAGERRRR